MKERVSPLLVRLVVLFTACLIISNILANRIILVGSWSIDAGILLFPVTYVLSDIFSEVYGYKWSRRVTFWAAGLNLLFAGLVALTNILPAPDYFDPAPFQMALGSSFRIVMASVVSYVLGDLVNDLVFRRMKKNHATTKGFAWRALCSSLAGQIIDSHVFVLIAFSGMMSNQEMMSMVALGIISKIGYEIVILPVTSVLAKEVYNRENKYKNVKVGGR